MIKMSITNKDSLRDYIHSIHDFLRNNGAGYGMTALKIFNIFYGLLKIEENEVLFKKLINPTKKVMNDLNMNKINIIFKYSKLGEKYKDDFIKLFIKNSDIENDQDYEILIEGFRKVFRFTNLLEYVNPMNQNDEDLYIIVNGPILDKLAEGILRNFLFYEIPLLRNEVYCSLVKKIGILRKQDTNSNIDDKHFQLNGKIYEYFIGRDKSAISEMGAYFTDRYIINYIYEDLLDPVLNEDGTVKVMIDMFGGSGGFTLGYTEYLINKYGIGKIDWGENINNIYHHDMNEDVVKSASLEMMCLTGIIPDEYNFMKDNSFNSEFNKKYYDYIVTNPPYGGDKNNKSEEQLKREKIKKYVSDSLKNDDLLSSEIIQIRKDQLKEINNEEKMEKDLWEKTKVTLLSCSRRVKDFCKKYNLNPNDKEGCSFIMLMEMLAPNGTAIGVLKEGVFFDGKYSNIRKVLIENYNVKKIISIHSKAFENTTTKTSIIVFSNTEEKTSKIDFFNLVVHKEEEDIFGQSDNGYIILTKNNGDIIEVTDTQTSSASIEKIRNKDYSLDFKVYEKSKIKCNEGYHFEKLGNISLINPKSKVIKKKYNYIEISNIENNQIIDYTNFEFEELPKNAKRLVKENDILISTVRPKKNKSLLIKNNLNNLDDYIFSGAFVQIRSTQINSKYIYFMLYNFIDSFEELLCNGSTYPRFNGDILNEYLIPIPNDSLKIEYWSNKIGLQFDLINSNKNSKTLFETLISELRNEAVCDCENDLIDEEININPEIVDDKSSVSSKSSIIKSNKSELLEEILYNPVKINVEPFAEIKKRLNNGDDIKIKCPCNNEIIFQSNHWDKHRKLDTHKDYLKQYFTVEEKKKSSKKIQVQVL
jgi:type I restriction-modification system DNA methylase subunit